MAKIIFLYENNYWISEFCIVKLEMDKEIKVASWKFNEAWIVTFVKEIFPNVESINLKFTEKKIFNCPKEIFVDEKLFWMKQFISDKLGLICEKLILQS